MSMEVPGLGLEDKIRYLQDAKEEVRVATAEKNRWQKWVSQELAKRVGETIPITGFVTDVANKYGDGEDGSWSVRSARHLESKDFGWVLPPNHYVICEVREGRVFVSTPGQEENIRYVVPTDTIALASSEQIAETEALYEQQRLEETTPVA